MRSLELRIPPAALVAAAVAIMWWFARSFGSLGLLFPGHAAAALAVAVLGAVVVASGLIEFRRARTTVNPLRPAEASALVTKGIYSWTRNPMYLGFALMLLAWGVYLSNGLSILVVPLFVAYMTRFQIVPEEHALERTFGAEFDRYRRRVRRWL